MKISDRLFLAPELISKVREVVFDAILGDGVDSSVLGVGQLCIRVPDASKNQSESIVPINLRVLQDVRGGCLKEFSLIKHLLN